jgi:uncharacterized protein YndB with AHSA1/START domain
MTIQPFVLDRTFHAPRALVWTAFTQADHLAKWFSPKGMTPGKNRMDFREGGVYHYEIITPDGTSHWGRWIYREIVDQERMVYHVSFSDEGCGITRHPMAPNWPLETLSLSEFSDVEGCTRIHLEMSVLGSDPVALKAFDEARSSMTQGWSGTMDLLDDYLANVQAA